MTKLTILHGGVPPAPNKASAQGFTASQFIQLEPSTQEDIDRQYFEGTSLNSIYPKTQNAYSIGGTDMRHAALGRYALNEFNTSKQSKETANNVAKACPGFQIVSNYSGTGDTNLHKDVWSMQTIVFWLTDGGAFAGQFPKMAGVVTKAGHSPSDLSPLKVQPNGRVVEDLKSVLPRKTLPSGETAPRGPDGIYGAQTDSILAEYIRTGKAFGKDIPSNVKPVFDRLSKGVTSNVISKAKQQKSEGLTTPAKTAANISPSLMSGAAQESAGLTLTKLNQETGRRPFSSSKSEPAPALVPEAQPRPQPQPQPQPKAKDAQTTVEDAEEEDNTMLYVGIGLGVLALAGGAFVMMNNKKKKDGGLPVKKV